MSDYPVITVTPESVLESEQLGTKDKFWFNTDDDYLGKSQWLFKFPTEGTGQHWAETIACEVAKQMRILTPRVEQAVFEGTRGSATENFTKDGYEPELFGMVSADKSLGAEIFPNKRWYC